MSFWALLLVGLALRCVAINQPLIDAHTIRQCQTAAVTKNLIEQPGFSLSSRIPWLGDVDGRFVLELPLYNYLVAGVHGLTGDLDVSGKMVSILLWASSFWVLQSIWRRLLNPQQVFWANLLFVFAPLSVFFAQAFMPEMLVQLLAFGFVLLILRHDELPTLSRWMACASVGLAGLLVKLPEVAHLYLLLFLVIFRRDGLRAFIRPRYVLAGAFTLLAVRGWSAYADSVNVTWLPEWTSKENLRGFIGPAMLRFQAQPWLMIAAYLGVFVFSGPAVVAALYGFWVVIRNRSAYQMLWNWLLTVALFYVLWLGNCGAAQNYYNLPALAPLCAVFGIGLTAVLSHNPFASRRRVAAALAILTLLISTLPVTCYLFKQDQQIFAAARSARDMTHPDDVIVFRPNHRFEMVDYPYNPVFGYYAERMTFVWSGNTSEVIRAKALSHAPYAVVTLPLLPKSQPGQLIAVIQRMRGAPPLKLESTDWLDKANFKPVKTEEQFMIYRRNKRMDSNAR